MAKPHSSRIRRPELSEGLVHLGGARSSNGSSSDRGAGLALGCPPADVAGLIVLAMARAAPGAELDLAPAPGESRPLIATRLRPSPGPPVCGRARPRQLRSLRNVRDSAQRCGNSDDVSYEFTKPASAPPPSIESRAGAPGGPASRFVLHARSGYFSNSGRRRGWAHTLAVSPAPTRLPDHPVSSRCPRSRARPSLRRWHASWGRGLGTPGTSRSKIAN